MHKLLAFLSLCISCQAFSATITATSHLGPPTSVTTLSGSGYAPSEVARFYFDRALVKTVRVGADGNQTRTVEHPPGLVKGHPDDVRNHD